jgi:hypothetical protein
MEQENNNKDNKNNINIYTYKRIIKYLFLSSIVFVLLRYYPNININDNENITLALTVGIIYGIMDLLYPSIEINNQ